MVVESALLFPFSSFLFLLSLSSSLPLWASDMLIELEMPCGILLSLLYVNSTSLIGHVDRDLCLDDTLTLDSFLMVSL